MMRRLGTWCLILVVTLSNTPAITGSSASSGDIVLPRVVTKSGDGAGSFELAMLGRDSRRPIVVAGSPEDRSMFVIGSFPVESLDLRRHASMAGNTVPGSISSAEAYAANVALSFVERHSALFGIRTPSEDVAVDRSEIDELGMAHVTIRQRYEGLPVYDALAKVHISADGRFVEAFTNELARDVRVPSTTPEINQAEARSIANRALPFGNVVAETGLVVYPLGERSPTYKLAYVIEVAAPEHARRYAYVVDAIDGTIIHVIDLVQELTGRSRAIYDAALNSSLPGTLKRSEGQASSGITDVDLAYIHLGTAYDYFWNTHRWDFGATTTRASNGGKIIGSVRYRSNTAEPYKNAFWDGERMVFGESTATRDIVVHEFGHALTSHTAALKYIHQIGAVNESFSDIWAYTLDPSDTTIGEGSALGVLRDMRDPASTSLSKPQPAHTADYVYTCEDCGGVHKNSGIPNRAFYLIRSHASVGASKAERIYFRALSRYLTPHSGFRDLRFKLAQAGQDLYGCANGEVLAIRNSFNNVGVSTTWRATSSCYQKTCACAATVTTDDTSLFSSAVEAANMAVTLYKTRDVLLVGHREYYRNLFYENSGDLALLFLNNADLRKRAANVLMKMAPGLTALLNGEGASIAVSPELTWEAKELFEAIAREDRAKGDGLLATVVERETARIDVAEFAGMTYEQAWDRFYAPGERERRDEIERPQRDAR